MQTDIINMVVENERRTMQLSFDDLYEDNNASITLYNDDTLKILKDMPSESIDLIVTDPPYRICSGGCSISYSNNPSGILNRRRKVRVLTNYEKEQLDKGIMYQDEKGRLCGRDRTEKGNYKNVNKHISLCGILNDSNQWTYAREGKLFKHNDIKFSDWLKDTYRVLKPSSHAYIMINARNLKNLWIEAEKVGFIWQQLIVWNKHNATPNKYYMNALEFILMFRKGNAKNINNVGTKNILDVPNIMNGKKLHPTEKPVKLMEILVKNSSNEGDIVLDPFMGVGSTGVACKKLNRNFIGIEIDEYYYKIAKERVECL